MLFLLLACADPAKDKAVATVSEPPKAAPAAPTAPPATTLTYHPASGSVAFVGAKVTDSHAGSFGKWSGKLGMGGLDLKSVAITVDMTSVDVEPERLANHLKSPDFFDVAQFPEASFVSTAITAGAPAGTELAGATHTIEGDMTLHGVTRRLTFPAVVNVSPDAVSARTEFALLRKDFGIVYPGKPDDLIRDEVLLKIDLVTNRANVMTNP